MKRLRHAPLLVGLLVVATVSWILIGRTANRSKWLQVEIPEQVVRGGRVPLTLTLKAPPPAGLLRVDLHWKDSRRESRGLLSTARPQLIRADESTYCFDLPVPSRPAPDYVYGVIYVSPTGRWAERTRTCTFEPIVVSPTIDPAKLGKSRRIAAYDQHPGPPPKRQDSRGVRWISSLLWSLAGILCWRVRWLRWRNPSSLAHPDTVRWSWLTLACLLAAAWEASTGEMMLGDLLRKFAISHDWYNGRRHLQEGLTVIVIAVAMVCAVVALRRDHAQPVSLVFSSADVYWSVSAVSFISLHDADAWLATPLFTIPVVQVVKLAAAFVAVSGAACSPRSPQPGGAGTQSEGR